MRSREKPWPGRVLVIETIEGLAFEELKSFYQWLERKARTTLDDLLRRVPEAPASSQSAVVYGRRAEEIVKFAGTNGVDLTVLASHRVNPSGEPRVGTISYQVGIHSALSY